MRIDGEFKNVIPPITGQEYEDLEKSILAEGCRDALILWGDILVDGHNRYEICQKHGVQYRVTQMDFDSRETALIWIIRNQIARRNLNTATRGELALKAKAVYAAQAKERQREHAGTAPGKPKEANKTLRQISDEVFKPVRVNDKPEHEVSVRQNSDERQYAKENARRTDAQIAKDLNVSRDTVRKVESVIKQAPESLKKAMRDGDISVNRAYEVAKMCQDDGVREKIENAEPPKMVYTANAIMKGTEEKEESDNAKKIRKFWRDLSQLQYSESDYEDWFSDTDDIDIKSQIGIVDKAVERVLKIQQDMYQICKERRKLRLIK